MKQKTVRQKIMKLISLLLINPIILTYPINPADSSGQHAGDRMDVIRMRTETGKQTA